MTPEQFTKICNTCKKEQHIENFGKYKSRDKVLRRNKCNKCRSKDQQKRYHNNPDIKEQALKNSRKSHLKIKYNMTVEEYNVLYNNQKGKCFICNKTMKGSLNIDHCHTTGKIRGLLCWSCNIGLGKFKDNKNYLQKAIEYLENTYG